MNGSLFWACTFCFKDSLKTSEDCEAEKTILSQLVAVVNQRSALIEMQERKRLNELSEHAPMMENAYNIWDQV